MTPTRETFGNIPAASQWLFYALSILAMVVFAWGVWRRVKLWRVGQPIGVRESLRGRWMEVWGRWKPGVKRVAVEGLGQERVKGRGWTSAAHIGLFIGFMMLFLGTTLLEIDHLAGKISESWSFHHGNYYVAYEFVLDVSGLLFLVGCFFFLWRRLQRPSSLGHRLSDYWVILSFIAIGVTGYLVEGLRIGWQKPTGLGAQCSPVGLWISHAFSGWNESSVRGWHWAVWWLHSLLVLGFIASIPFTRLFHFIAGPLNLLLAKPTLGALTPVSMEFVEKEGRVGPCDIRHFTQQQLLSLDACMECGRCEEACPAFATQKPLSPKKVVQDLKGLMEGGKEGGLHDTVVAETLWSCTACSACTGVCPVRVDPLGLILELRRHRVAEGELSGTAATALRRLQSSSNPWGLPLADRAAWTEGLHG